jgi:hypothetical protein
MGYPKSTENGKSLTRSKKYFNPVETGGGMKGRTIYGGADHVQKKI